MPKKQLHNVNVKLRILFNMHNLKCSDNGKNYFSSLDLFSHLFLLKFNMNIQYTFLNSM